MSNVTGILGIMSGDDLSAKVQEKYRAKPSTILGRDGGLYDDYDLYLRVDAMHVGSDNFPEPKIR